MFSKSEIKDQLKEIIEKANGNYNHGAFWEVVNLVKEIIKEGVAEGDIDDDQDDFFEED